MSREHARARGSKNLACRRRARIRVARSTPFVVAVASHRARPRSIDVKHRQSHERTVRGSSANAARARENCALKALDDGGDRTSDAWRGERAHAGRGEARERAWGEWRCARARGARGARMCGGWARAGGWSARASRGRVGRARGRGGFA